MTSAGSRNTKYLHEENDKPDFIELSVRLRNGGFDSKIAIPVNIEREQIVALACGWIGSMQAIVNAVKP